MQIGDLVWHVQGSDLDPRMIRSRRLAVIIDMDNRCLGENRDRFVVNKYTITLVECGNTGTTSEKYLEPLEVICK